jgi:surface protein
MSSMFEYAGAFNQPLDGWDTSRVYRMEYMFQNAKAFNQKLDWNTSSLFTVFETENSKFQNLTNSK